MKKWKNVVAFGLSVLLAIGMMPAGAAQAAQDKGSQGSKGKAGGFSYTVSGDGSAVITGVDSSLKGDDNKGADKAILVPAEVDGLSVSSFGDGGILLTNFDGDVLFPEGMTKIADGAIYDVGNAGTAFFSFPSTIKDMGSGALASTANVFYSDSKTATKAAEDYGIKEGSAKTGSLTITAGKNGSVYPNGTYLVPDDADSTYDLHITSDLGYAISSVEVNGKEVDVDDQYNTSVSVDLAQGEIDVEFEKDDSDTRTSAQDPADSYEAPAIDDGAVAEGTSLPDDVNEYVPDVDGEGDNKYPSTMGVETGTWYAQDGTIYKMVKMDQNTCYRSKAEVINAAYENDGLVYGKDYNLIRLYNYVHNYQNGPRPGNFVMYCTYLYKSEGKSMTDASSNATYEGFYEHDEIETPTFSKDGMIQSDSIQKVEGSDKEIQGDVATVFVNNGSAVTFKDLQSTCNTVAYGPSEAANFYGLGSSILVNGGDSKNYKISDGPDSYSFDQSTDKACLVLEDPSVIGIENVLYAVAGGTAYVHGGRFFGSSSGGHGFYVGMGGKIAINADDVLTASGNARMDVSSLTAAERPALDLGTAVKAEDSTNSAVKAAIEDDNWDTPAAPEFKESQIPDGTSVLVTADETGTALTTDTGGGVIVANNISATTYGRGCAGVYSIGADESYVYVYNSALHSNMDGALVSASAGYIMAYNTELKGVDGIKTRSGGSGTYQGIDVYNSSITCDFDPDNYDFYDMATPDDAWPQQYKNWQFADDKSLVNCPMLNLFINKTNAQYGSDLTDVMKYWYEDKNTAPQTGEAMAPICSTGTAPINIYSSYIVNNNYKNYKDDGAHNILIAADNAGSGTISFYDCNSDTKWDLTGEEDQTTELSGDINIAATVTMTGPDAGSGPSSAPVDFHNSEWTGSVTGYGRGAQLAFDDDSVWNVDTEWSGKDDSVTVGTLDLAKEDNIVSDSPVTIYVLDSMTIGGKPVTEKTVIGNVTFEPANSAVYSDITGSESADAAIGKAADDLYYNDVITGESGDASGSASAFRPDDNMTRAELVEALYKMADTDETASGDASYPDVDSSAPYYDAVEWANANGITKAFKPKGILAFFSGKKFKPDKEVTRQQALEAIYAAQDAIGYSTDESGDASVLSGYSDANKLSASGEAAAEVLVANGLYSISGDAIGPKDPVTRGEMAVVLDAVYNAIPSGGMMPPPGM